jgi:radical SAM-linked protein
MEQRIIPHRDLRAVLPRVEKPGRYVGGEFGSLVRDEDGYLRVAISYPDLYEIGMSNTSVRLIYRLLNDLEGVACERVFAPAMDFEAELRARGLPLYALESGRPLSAFDVVGFSVGYELTFTNLLNILDLGGIPILRRERSSRDPIVVAGGPAVTNPVPFGAVVDAVFIGEIEGEGIELFGRLAALKKRGASREQLLGELTVRPFVWTEDKKEPVRRVLWGGFGGSATGGGAVAVGGAVAGGEMPPGMPPPGSAAAWSAGTAPAGMRPAGAPSVTAFPVPSLRTVQDHGVVEIMRGCPHGCRFCHAGIFYRPFRMKDPAAILAEVDEAVLRHGYREVTLASLSTGDYPGITGLVRLLNERYREERVSFNLPSLRVSTLTLDLLTEVSSVRKTGLTFAVETPLPEWQAGINKPVSEERIADLLREARARGWKQAKFYFMIGLPVAQGRDETGPILELLASLRDQVRMELVVNVSGFIPKPHTPFQWSPQLSEAETLERIMRVKRGAPRGVQVRYHSPFLSILEGVVSRGDGRSGELFVEAFRRGARFDAWEDLVDRRLWRSLFAETSWEVEAETCRARSREEELPWRQVRLGVSEAYLAREGERALAGEQTSACCVSCTHACGVCRDAIQVKELPPDPDPCALARSLPAPPSARQGERRRVLFSFAKRDGAVYLSHLDLVQVFERALLRAGFRAVFTEGYNPKPRLEFAQPLSVGVIGEAEIARCEVANFTVPEEFREAVNGCLPAGIEVGEVRAVPPLQPGEKKHSLMGSYRGAEYRIEAAAADGQGAAGTETALAEKAAARALEAVVSALRDAARAATAGASGGAGLEILSADERTLVLRVVPAGKGTGSVLKLLGELGIADPPGAGLTVTRLRLLGAAPGTEGRLVDYFDATGDAVPE